LVDDVAAFVDEAVVAAADQEEVVEVGLAAAGPVLDVVAVDVHAVFAAGEAAMVVARPERACYRGWGWCASFGPRARFGRFYRSW
jgi:hypothetical protein